MERLCQILSYDIGRFFIDLINSLIKICYERLGKKKATCKGGSIRVKHPSYTIRHKYPKRLVTYDGEANCERRLIRFSDLTKSDIAAFKDECEDEDEQDENDEDNEEDDECDEEEEEEEEVECQKEQSQAEVKFDLINFINNLTKPKSSSDRKSAGQDCSDDAPPNENFFLKLQQQAKVLYQNWVRCNQAQQQVTSGIFWESLSPAHQLRFYWSAYTGEELQPTPFENFSQSYKKDFIQSTPCSSKHTLRAEIRRQWACMKRCQRMPFIMQALIYEVSVNDVDPNDHCALRDLFSKFR
ncbi:uncharacterized protein [Drosophila tropicalis]|uniref:uncharacterized protein n=1 Tax=Drosophila tropicalis TaxID=46794 RepID=UPI0035ABF6E9